MVKDGEDGLGLQTAKLKNLGPTFQNVQPLLCSFKNVFSPAARLSLGSEKSLITFRPHYFIFTGFLWLIVFTLSCCF